MCVVTHILLYIRIPRCPLPIGSLACMLIWSYLHRGCFCSPAYLTHYFASFKLWQKSLWDIHDSVGLALLGFRCDKVNCIRSPLSAARSIAKTSSKLPTVGSQSVAESKFSSPITYRINCTSIDRSATILMVGRAIRICTTLLSCHLISSHAKRP